MWSVCGQLSVWGQEVQAQAVSEMALVPRSAYILVVEPNGVQDDPHWGFLASPRGQCFSSGGQAECCIVVWIVKLEGLWASSLRTESENPC